LHYLALVFSPIFVEFTEDKEVEMSEYREEFVFRQLRLLKPEVGDWVLFDFGWLEC